MQAIGLSTPLTAAQRPFIMWVGGTDVINFIDKTSYFLDDRDLTQPAIFTFVLTDPANVAGKNINRLDEVMWYETLTTNGTGRILFRGYVRQIDVAIIANYATWTITCTDISELLDYAQPVASDERGPETALARIQHLLGDYSSVLPTGGFIGTLSGGVQDATAFQRETVRTAIEKTIALEASLVQPAPAYYLDYYYQLHVFYGKGDVAAPYNLTDVAPDHTTTVNYSGLLTTLDSTQDADRVFVFGSTVEGSGETYLNVPRWPTRSITIDASASTGPVELVAAGNQELGLRQGITRVQVVVTGYDGWLKGQHLTLTNAVLGLSAVTFWITGVSMRVLSGTGYREYTLQLNASLPRFSRISASTQPGQGPSVGGTIQGQIGGY
jgi:hypothetical protein